MEYGRTEHDLGEVLRRYGKRYEQTHPMSREQRLALHDLSRCRTAILGGHIEHCPNCGYEHPSYNSCGNRNCPKCQGIKQRKWLKERLSELLPVQYFHSVFTIAQEYHVFAKYSAESIYKALFWAASKVVLRQMKKRYGVTPGIIAILHTWGQKLQRHPHVHMIITGGGLSTDKSKWIHSPGGYLLDVVELQQKFKEQFCREMLKLQKNNKLRLNTDRKLSPTEQQVALVNDKACSKLWNVNIQKPFSGPQKILEYVSRYTHCVAIRNSRIRDIAADGTVSVDCKNYKKRDKQDIPEHELVKFTPEELIGAFMTHVLPKGFRKLRMYGIYGGNNRTEKIELCQSFFPVDSSDLESDSDVDKPPEDMLCPKCMIGIMETTTRTVESERAPPEVYNMFSVEKQFKKAS